jgi:hypothetical protein
MRYAQHLKINKAMIEDTDFTTSLLFREINRIRRRMRQASKVVFNPTIELGHDGPDFMNDMVTARITYKAFKAPRIVFKANKKTS